MGLATRLEKLVPDITAVFAALSHSGSAFRSALCLCQFRFRRQQLE